MDSLKREVLMQQNDDKLTKPPMRPRLGRTRFVEMQPGQNTTSALPVTGDLSPDLAAEKTAQTLPLTPGAPRTPLPGERSGIWRIPSQALHFMKEEVETQVEIPPDEKTAHLLQLSGMMRTVHLPDPAVTMPAEKQEYGYWPLGIQQVGPLPVINLYGRASIGRTLPRAVSVVMPEVPTEAEIKAQPAWLKIPASPIFKISLALFVGLDLLFLISRFINLPLALQGIQTHLATPAGIALTLLAAVIYLGTHALQGLRWKLFLNPLGQKDLRQALEISQIANLLNFLLPLHTGEAAKGLMLKQTASIPVSKSLPTVAMDRSLDIAVALLIIAFVPLLGISMNIQLWIVSGLDYALLLMVLVSVILRIWRGPLTRRISQKLPGWLFTSFGGKFEHFPGSLVDALLDGARYPLIFTASLVLTAAIFACNTLFLMVVFWTSGFSIPFGSALAGCAISLFFTFLPVPPGRVGTYEIFGLLLFTALLGLPGGEVVAVALFAHLLTAILLTASGLVCLKMLGLTFRNVLRTRSEQLSSSPTITDEATI